MDNKVIDFGEAARNRRNTAEKKEDTVVATPVVEVVSERDVPRISAAVSKLLPVAMNATRFYPERVRQFFDQWVKEFFDALDQTGRVVIINYASGVTYESDLLVEKADGTAAAFPVHSFVRITAPDPSRVLPEEVDDYLLRTFGNWDIRISLRQEDESEGDRFDESRLDEMSLSQYLPENLPITVNTNQKNSGEYACYFSELENYVSSITAEHFVDPEGLSVLELMCLAYTDFLQAGNRFESSTHDMVVEFEQSHIGIQIKTIPLSLVQQMISDSIARKDVRFSNYEPEVRIWKYLQANVLPRVNPEVYVATYSE